MDAKIVGNRIKTTREKQNLTQEQLADKANLSPTHISVIERGLKVPKLDNFVAIANALGVSADELLFEVVDCSALGTTNRLSEIIAKLPAKEQKRIIELVKFLVEN